MSGRDFRAFITSRCSEETEKLTRRTQADLGSSKCKLTQYEQLRNMLEAKRLSSQRSEQKVQQVLRAAQVMKEKSVLRQHRQVWIQEHYRLNTARYKAEEDFQSFLCEVGFEHGADTCVPSELLEDELNLEQEREAFRLATVEPVHQLRDDLQYRLTSHCTTANHSSELQDVLQQVVSVRQQQEEVMLRLQCECVALQQQISDTQLKERLLSAVMGDPVSDLEKIPKEIITADCPYPDLRSDLINSFISLTDKYKHRLQTVQDRLQGMDRNCGWNEADHEFFKHIVSQYSPALRNQHALCTNMLQRALPHISPQELGAHERCSNWYHFSVAQRHLILQGWQRDRSELLLRALSVLDESRINHLKQKELQNQRSHQHSICLQLREKLQKWRAQQDEAVELEAALTARLYKEEEDRLKKQQHIEKSRRARLTQQVNKFHEEQQRRREEQRMRDMERLAELRKEMEEQMKRDKEKVKFREELLQQKIQQREAKEKQKKKEEDEREERLQALRNQVCKVAEADPERMMGETAAWRVRQHSDEVFPLQRPLYQLNTYTDTQIASDPRLRVEQALRSAGLHNTVYARHVLSEIQPLKPPRRDMESTVFRS
ncbi:coiled-coil domain-containing protein 148-like isoform X2 [Xyrauchen texanus]|uniref:coiled-coil domain-containing protein 148-like isoform X1 n=1 Tax=Xyrauchen texanus TaxID=154827 RepID=UPI0022429BD5|nr:coiled-coil domain-containing protein 148-like isoform X1 [Xyrauchen texanus]XP_052004707.1 coiled-coil domain-containing protein 148-like isoform X2 [Xyrauchen texanus]